MTPQKFNDILEMVQMDPEARAVFLAMPREEQLLAILGMQQWTRSELATVKKQVIGIEENLKETQRESRQYRTRREKKESDDGDDVSTTQKIAKEIATAFAQRFDFWTWFRDKVLPQIITFITLALLALAFADKLAR